MLCGASGGRRGGSSGASLWRAAYRPTRSSPRCTTSSSARPKGSFGARRARDGLEGRRRATRAARRTGGSAGRADARTLAMRPSRRQRSSRRALDRWSSFEKLKDRRRPRQREHDRAPPRSTSTAFSAPRGAASAAHAPLYDALSFVAPRTVAVEYYDLARRCRAARRSAAEASLISTGTERQEFYRAETRRRRRRAPARRDDRDRDGAAARAVHSRRSTKRRSSGGARRAAGSPCACQPSRLVARGALSRRGRHRGIRAAYTDELGGGERSAQPATEGFDGDAAFEHPGATVVQLWQRSRARVGERGARARRRASRARPAEESCACAAQRRPPPRAGQGVAEHHGDRTEAQTRSRARRVDA